jgi:hypothetical protein
MKSEGFSDYASSNEVGMDSWIFLLRFPPSYYTLLSFGNELLPSFPFDPPFYF